MRSRITVPAAEEPGRIIAPRNLDLKTIVRGDTPLFGVLGVLEPMDVLARGALVGRDCKLQDAVAVFELDDVLDRSLAIGALADNLGPFVVLETGRDDL